jgi:hypothetical protein
MKILSYLMIICITAIITFRGVDLLPQKAAEIERERVISLKLEQAAALHRIDETRGLDLFYVPSSFVVWVKRDYLTDKEFEKSLMVLGQEIGKLESVDIYVTSDAFKQHHLELLKGCHGIFLSNNTTVPRDRFEQFCKENNIIALKHCYWGQRLINDSVTIRYE